MNQQLPVNQWRVLFFSPNAGLWQTSQLEHELANGLAQQGAQVTVIRCNGLFDTYCPTMQANFLTMDSPIEEKAGICKACRREEDALRRVAHYSTIWIDDFLSVSDRHEIDIEIGSITPSNWASIEKMGIPVGRYSTYLTMLHYKAPDVTAAPNIWNEYLSDVKNSLYAMRSLPIIVEQTKPTHAVVYNPLYPTNRMFTELVLQKPDIQYVGLSASGYVPERLATLALYRSVKSSQTVVDSQTITESANVPMSELEIRLVARHVGQLVQGSDPWVYSTPPTALGIDVVKQKLGITTDRPTALVVIGSPDETRSSALVDAEFERVPIDQVASVQEFIEQILEVARHEPHINFVFRLHPRLAPNKREKHRSPDLDAIEELLSDLPDNVVTNVPNDGIGLYDVARIAQVGINHASSAGLELLALGIPVVHYDPPRLNAYPPSLGLEVIRCDQDGMRQALAQALDTPISAENSVAAWRWYAVTLLRAVTHKSWDTPQPVDLTQSQPKLQWVRNVLPESFRERVSRTQSQRKRTKQIIDSQHSDDSPVWINECITRMAGFDNSTIWNPVAITRGTPLPAEQEEQLVVEEVNRIWARIAGNRN